MKYWIMKTEPSSYSIDDLKRDTREPWDGVRNYQARNYMRDDMKIGDVVFFYHSNIAQPGIVGEATVCSAPYPDPTAFDPKDSHYDSTSTTESSRWYLVDICYKRTYKHTLTLEALRKEKRLAGLPLLARGQRLSVQPVTEVHARHILSLVKTH